MISCIFGENPSTGLDEQIWKDIYTGAITQIDIAHAAIHLGKYFSHSGIISALGNGASYDHLLITPAVPSGKNIHLRLFLFDTSSAPISHFLYEDSTVSANGAAQVGYNFNRNSAVATLGLYHAPTVTGVGTQINTGLVAGTRWVGGAGETSGTEWVLKPNSNYISRVTNNSGGAADIGYHMEWYELA